MPSSTPGCHGTLDDFLAADDLVAVPDFSARDWDQLRRASGWQMVRRFCTLRNLVVHRGRFTFDAMGFAWGGIYRTLLVTSIVTTSYRNEGHFRADDRIFGTADFFYGGFALPTSAAEFREIVRLVNLRHHVAGVVSPDQAEHVRVRPGYEADYTYVATAFIESVRRGLDLCGLPRDSRAGRQVATRVCAILYKLAGFTGLGRMPRDLDAHDRFRDAYDRRLRERPPSSRVRRMAQEIAHRIVPFTAFMAGSTVSAHVHRHIDPETREFLFPGGRVPEALERRRLDWIRQRRGRQRTLAEIEGSSRSRQALWDRPDVAALREAYRQAVLVNTDDELDDRLIGAILLHMIDAGGAAEPFERRSIELAAGQPLIRQGHAVDEMLVVLSATAPLVVLHASEPGTAPRQVAALAAPTVLGEIGMWRRQPAVATVLSRETNRLDALVIDARRFERLKQESGFRAATAAEVQRRLSLNAAVVGTLLDDAAALTGDRLLASIAQLFRFLTGDSHGPIDRVIDLADDATPAECVEALRTQIDEAIRGGGLPPDLERHLGRIVATIG